MDSTQLAYEFVQKFNQIILFPTIALLSAIALLVFTYGCFLYIVRSGDPGARAQGVKHITWGVVGLVVMLSAYTILSIAAGTFGFDDELKCANDPSRSGCDNVVIPLNPDLSGPGQVSQPNTSGNSE